MKSSNFAVGETRRDATRGDATRRGSLPFGLIARQWLRPLPGPRTLLCTRRLHTTALTWSLTQCCCTRDSLERGAAAAIIRCSFAFRRSVTVTLRLCPPNVRCIQLAHYAPPAPLSSWPPARGSQLRFVAFALLFGFLLLVTRMSLFY